LAPLEGWHRGPSAEPISDPEQIGAVLRDLARRAKRTAGITDASTTRKPERPRTLEAVH
jgi:hypothetical protein